jgi:RHS repeat-associated protein
MKKRTKKTGKQLISLLLSIIIFFTGIPFIPGGALPRAKAATVVSASPSQINAVYGETARINWQYTDPARDPITNEPIQTEHPTDVALCGGDTRSIVSGENFPVLTNNSVTWDGQVDTGAVSNYALDGAYNVCVTPTDFPSEKQDTSITVFNPNPPAPTNLDIRPNYDPANNDPHVDTLRRKTSHEIRGLAEIGTEVTLYYTRVYREGVKQIQDPTERELVPLSGKILTQLRSSSWAQGFSIDANYFNAFPVNSNKTPGSLVGEWEAEIELKENETYKITAVTKRIRDGKVSAPSSQYAILRHEIKDNNVTWESLAGYFYVAKTVPTMVSGGQKIAKDNVIPFKPCLGVAGGCPGLLDKGVQLLIYNPEWAGTYEPEELDYLTHIEKITNPAKYPRPIGLDPVNLATGDFVFSHTNLSLQAAFPLEWSITYHSRDTFNGAIGYGWHHSYEWKLERREGEVIAVTTPEGASYEYQPQADGTFRPPFGTYNTLTKQLDETYLMEMPNHWIYLFRQDGVLLSITNPNQLQIHLSYNGTVLTQIHTDGAELNLQYGDAGKIATITDQSSREVRYTYDNNQHDLKSVTLPDGGMMKFDYDQNHRITEIRNPNDTASLVNVYNEEGKVKEQTDFRGVKGYITYDTENHHTKIRDELGRIKTYMYDERLRQTAIEYPDGTFERFEYDNQDNIKVRTDRNGHTSRFSYDLNGNLEQAIDPIGAITTMKYNEWNQPKEIIDSLGHSTLLSYDNRGKVTAIENALGEVNTIQRDAKGVVTGVLNAEGEYVTIENDAQGFAKWVTDPSGAKSNLERDPLHRVTQMIDALGQISGIQYDARDRLVAKQDALGQLEEFRYDKDSNLIYHKDAAGAETNLQYQFDKVSKIEDALGNETEFIYDALNRLKQMKDASGAVTEYKYDVNDRPSTIIVKDRDEDDHEVLLTTTLEYDAVGNITKRIDPRHGVTEINYDERDLPVQVKDATGGITNYTYNKQGQLIRNSNALEAATTYQYDALGRLIQQTDALGQSMTYGYDKAGRLTSTTKPNGAVWQLQYDVRGALIATVDPMGHTTSLERDVLGRVVHSMDEAGQITSYNYDKLGRVTSITNPLGYATTMTYDPMGRVKKVTDANNQSTTYAYNLIGQLESVTNALGATTSYDYDTVGNITSKMDALGRVTSYQYNQRHLLTQEINPLGQPTKLDYDSNNNVVSVIYPDNKATHYDYDAVNSLTSVVYPDQQHVQYTHDLLGRRTMMVDATGTTSYAYDALNRLAQVTNGANQTIGYEWTPTGQRSKVVYPDQTSVTYQYDLLDRMTNVTDGSGLTTNYTYDNRGLLTQKKLPTQGVSTYQYDALGQVQDLRHANQFGKVVEHLQYAYDPVGNRTRLERVEDGNDEDDSDSEDHQDSMITEYAYDALNQLTQVRQYNSQTAETPSLTNYNYDAVGNRLTKQSAWDSLTNTENYTYDSADKLLHWQSGSNYKDFTYDPRGNLLRVMGIEQEDESLTNLISTTVLNQVYGSDAVTAGVYGTSPSLQSVSAASSSNPDLFEEYIWDSANRLKQHRSAKQDISQFFYDGDGNRTKMIVDVDHGPTDHGDGGNGQGNSNGNGNGNNGNGNSSNKCHEVPPGFIPPGLAKKCGQVEEPYPDLHPGGPREGWEKEFKKKHWEFDFTNDVSLANPEPLQVTDKDQLSGASDFYRWKQTYAYGVGGERISMTYLPAYDANNGWDPHDGTAGAEPGVAPRTLFYLNDALGSAVGLIEKDGRVSSRYHYDEFGIPTDAKKFDMNWPGPDNLFGYTGLGYDYNSGVSYARARYYKPELGRFISEDTYKGSMWNPQSQNLYDYVQNNPINWIDPSGHAQEKINDDGRQSTNSLGFPRSGPSVSSMIDAVRIAGVSNTYWQNRSDLGSIRQVFAWSSMSRNQFFYLYGLATKTVCADENTCRNATEQEKYNYFTDGNAEWAKQQLIYELDVNEISKRADEQFLGALGSTARFSIGEKALKEVSKKWGQKGLDAFYKSANKGIVNSQGQNGITVLKGNVEKNGVQYTHEIKVLNKEYGDHRILGYINDAGEYVFDWFRKGLGHK